MLEDEDPTSRDALFNGEIVVDASSHPKRARDGLQPASPKDAVGFNQVSIGTAGSASRDALERTRNPLDAPVVRRARHRLRTRSGHAQVYGAVVPEGFLESL